MPVLLATALGLNALNPERIFEPPFLLPVLNTLFISITAWVVAFLAANSFRQGAPRVVLAMGAALLALGTGSLISGVLADLPGGINPGVTVFNLVALLAALAHMSGAVEAATQTSPRGPSPNRTLRLVLAYAGVLLAVGLVAFLAVQNALPTFFVQGTGPTPLRQLVLGSAAALFGLASLLLLRLYWNSRSDFLYWYAMALALNAAGLLIVLLPSNVGNLTTWLGRLGQYASGLCFLPATAALLQDRRERGLSLELAIAELFRDAELNYQALVETSPDAILVADRAGRVLICNPAAANLLGVERHQALGGLLGDLVRVQAPAGSLMTKVDELLQTGRQHWAGTLDVQAGPRTVTIDATLSVRRARVGWLGTFILRDVTERMRLEQALRDVNDRLERRVAERTAALNAAVERLHSLSAHLQTVREQDQARFARDLHDDLGQILTALRIELNILSQTVAEQAAAPQAQGEGGFVAQEALAEPIRDLDTLLKDGLASLRRLLNELRPEALHRLGLVPALDKLGQDFQSRTGVQVRFSPELQSRVEDTRALALYRIAQEALTNVARHARASEVHLAIAEAEGQVQLVIADNGRGIPEAANRRSGHFGLLGMQERALALRGTLDVVSAPGGGTTITARLPLVASPEPEPDPP